MLCVALYCNVILVDQRGGRIVGSAGGGGLGGAGGWGPARDGDRVAGVTGVCLGPVFQLLVTMLLQCYGFR